jgi:succinyl-CoA synthetase beta subunit
LKLLEYQAKEIFEKYGLSTPKGTVIDSKEDVAAKIAQAGLSYPVVIKAQVQVGGRGKAGGVKFADSGEEAQSIVDTLLFSDLKGLKVNKLLVVEKADVAKEWYLSILLDRKTNGPVVIFSAAGGMEIEETAKTNPDAIVNVPVNPLTGITAYFVNYVCSKSGVGMEYTKVLGELLTKLYKMFIEHSCMLAEINPVSVTSAGELVAIDGKVTVDDSALYRLPDVLAYRDAIEEPPLVVEARSFRFLYIPVSTGRVAVMSNGSGMLMSMIDLLSKKGVTVACALDLGGGATRDRIKEAVRIELSTPGVDTIFICIFGGITRCDEVADGVRMALENESSDKTVIIRMEGTNKDAGMEIVNSTKGAISVGGIVEGVETVAKVLKGGDAA